MKKKQRARKAKKIALIVLGVIAGLIVAAYIAGCVFFSSTFYPNTTMGSMDVSMKSAQQVAADLDAAASDYTLTVEGEGNLSFALTMEEAAMSLDSGAVVKKALGMNPCFLWPYAIFHNHNVSGAVQASFDKEALDKVVSTQIKKHNKTATDPQNATIGYNKETDTIDVLPEQLGTKYDVDAAVREVENAAGCASTSVVLTQAALTRPAVLSDDPALAEAAEKAKKFLGADLKLKLGKKTVAEINSELIAGWITVDKNNEPTLDQKKLKAWVKALGKDINTVGTKRTWTNPGSKKKYTVKGGDYGWKIGVAKLTKQVQKAVAKGRTGDMEIKCDSVAKTYQGPGKADWGKRYVDVNLTKQTARFYDNGKIIWRSKIVSGKPDGEHNTPTGVFDLNKRSTNEKLTGWENGKKIYESHVRYWMAFDGNVIGLHDADWQAAFGGQRYKQGYGSHGCVNLPVSKAAELYNLIKVGDPVIVHF